MTSNRLQLLHKGEGAYVLVEKHGETPLTPKALDISPFSNAEVPLNYAARATVTSCLLIHSSSRGLANVLLSTGLYLPSRIEVLVTCQLPKSYKDQLGMITPLTPIQDELPLSASIFAAYSVSQADCRQIPVRLMNCSKIDIELQAGQKVTEFCPLVESPVDSDSQECSSLPSMNMACSTSSVSDIQSDLQNALSPSLSPLERRTHLKILMQYSDVFDPSLGHTTIITHKIDAGAAPIRRYPKRLPYAYREETDKRSPTCCNKWY